LEEDVKRLIKNKDEIEEENNLTIMGLSKKLQSTQQQCKDLFLLGEAIKKESDHFKGIFKEYYSLYCVCCIICCRENATG
jgi:hypothetical protein